MLLLTSLVLTVHATHAFDGLIYINLRSPTEYNAVHPSMCARACARVRVCGCLTQAHDGKLSDLISKSVVGPDILTPKSIVLGNPIPMYVALPIAVLFPPLSCMLLCVPLLVILYLFYKKKNQAR